MSATLATPAPTPVPTPAPTTPAPTPAFIEPTVVSSAGGELNYTLTVAEGTVNGVTARDFVNSYLAKFLPTRAGAKTPEGDTVLVDDVAAPEGDDDEALAADRGGDKCGGYGTQA